MDPYIDAFIGILEKAIAATIQNALSKQNSVVHAATVCLGTHVANNWRAIICLLRTNTSKVALQSVTNPIVVLIRCSYDAYLQACFIVGDPQLADQRAQDYLDFQHVERWEEVKHMTSCNAAIFRRIANSPKRAAVELLLKAAFDQVKHKYQNSKGETRHHWYKGHLGTLANDSNVKKLEEYRFYVSFSNSSVHAGPRAVIKGPLLQEVSIENFVFAVTPIILQMLELMGKTIGFDLGADARKLVADFGNDVLHSVPGPNQEVHH